MSWEHYKLNDICKSISDGDHQPPPKAENGIPFVTIANITNANKFDFSKTMFVPQEYYDKLDDKRRAHMGDILYSVVGSFGIPVYMSEEQKFVFQRHIAILRPDETKVVPQFLYYTMLSRDFYMKADAVALGAAQRTVSLTSLRGMDVVVPDLEIQKKIVDILKPYDELIENNQKQIKLLEEAAQRLYKEWFVDLRFPRYEETEIVDGVPEGWESKAIEELIEYEIGGGWGEGEPSQKSTEPAYVVRGTDMVGVTHGDYSSIPFRYHAKSNLESRKLADGDIIFEVSGGSKTEGVAKTCLVIDILLEQYSHPVICASFCKKIRPVEGLSQFLFDTFQYMRKSGKTTEYDKKSASSIVNYRWKDFLVQEYIALPKQALLNKYIAVAAPIYGEIQTLSIEIEKAKYARDRLLPKLISGEIEV